MTETITHSPSRRYATMYDRSCVKGKCVDRSILSPQHAIRGRRRRRRKSFRRRNIRIDFSYCLFVCLSVWNYWIKNNKYEYSLSGIVCCVALAFQIRLRGNEARLLYFGRTLCLYTANAIVYGIRSFSFSLLQLDARSISNIERMKREIYMWMGGRRETERKRMEWSVAVRQTNRPTAADCIQTSIWKHCLVWTRTSCCVLVETEHGKNIRFCSLSLSLSACVLTSNAFHFLVLFCFAFLKCRCELIHFVHCIKLKNNKKYGRDTSAYTKASKYWYWRLRSAEKKNRNFRVKFYSNSSKKTKTKQLICVEQKMNLSNVVEKIEKTIDATENW